jgi:1-deoxy-D-xylulose 5-phosphate reductoisomerase
VQAFLDGKIRFTQIIQLVASTMKAVEYEDSQQIEKVLHADAKAREYSSAKIEQMAGAHV